MSAWTPHTVKGGSWHYSAAVCRAAYRGDDLPGYRFRARSFRLVLRLSAQKNQTTDERKP